MTEQCFTTQITMCSGKEYKSQPMAESMEANLKVLIKNWQKRKQVLVTQQPAEEPRRNKPRSLPECSLYIFYYPFNNNEVYKSPYLG